MGRAHRGIAPLDTARRNVQELQAQERAESETKDRRANADAFEFNGDNQDLEQVRRYYAAYEDYYVKLLSKGTDTYDADFKGKVPGLAGPDEDKGIRLLQRLRVIAEGDAEYSYFLSLGFKPLSHIAEPHEHVACREIVRYQVIGGVKSEWRRFRRASVVFDENGKPSSILAKGATATYRLNRHAELLVR